MHVLEFHPTPKNLLETIFDPRRTISATVFSLTATQRSLCTRQRCGEFHSRSSQPRPATSITSAAELDHTGPSLSYPSVSVRTVSWVFRCNTDVRRLAEEFPIDPTLRYLVSFLLRNLVKCDNKCPLRPFKVFGHYFRLYKKDRSLPPPTLCFVNRFSWFVKRCTITLIGD